VREPLGEGGMASVWKVHDQVDGRDLALKRLARADPKHVALFEREYHTLATLHHPCIVEVFDYGADAEGPFYTMELLEGTDVSRRAPMPYVEACRILRDVASGVALLHARRLLHRDLSARNVWLMPDGRVKLIDFGAMATFGKPADVSGTPPFIAPEAHDGLALDQRADLYALGALGYYLLTGRHAFPARSLVELPARWRERPKPVSKRVAELDRQDLVEVPPALGGLIDALLSRDPLARPTTAADVIDRLSVIAGLKPAERIHQPDGYLQSPAFVARSAERQALRDAFAAAAEGRSSSVVVESAPGFGRTRLLGEFALEARLAGAVVLHADPHAHRSTHGTAIEYAVRLLAALPGPAMEAAAPYASTLGHLSAELKTQLRVERLAPMPQAYGEARMRVQAALRDWFLDVAREHLLVIVADDLDVFDEGSAAWLAALTRAAGAHELLTVASARMGHDSSNLAVQSVRQSSTRLVLGALSSSETAELFRSVFGEVQHLARFVDLVHQRAEGSPGHAMDLAEHLRREGVVEFTLGAWVLPQAIAEGALPANRLDADVARLGRLSEHARKLGQVLSVREGTIPLEMCVALSEAEGPLLFDGLEALVREGVLAGSAEGYRFSRESLREILNAELDGERRRRAHRVLGRFILGRRDVSELERLKAGVHLLRGGEEDAGSLAVCIAGKHYGLVDLADLGPAAPSLEAALAHFRATGRSLHEIIAVLSPLALAGYYADRRLAVRYGEDAVAALEHVVGLGTARRLRPFLGRKLALFAALGSAAIAFAFRRKNPRVPKLREAILLLFNCVAALTGVCTICIDPDRAQKYADVLEPMSALGPNHVATFMYHFCLNLVGTIRDDVGKARANWTKMIERLDRPNAVRDFPAHVHALYLAGALYARGVAECWRDDSRALECAERLDALKLKLYDMSADQVRMMYYANRGNAELFERYRQRVEVHAIQRGTAWQVEMWTFSGLITVYLRTQDLAGLKACVEQLRRLSAEVPSLEPAYDRALSAYFVVRGTPSEACGVVGRRERPKELVGWTRGEGLRAWAYNALGEHARAKETCERALALLAPEDYEFTALNLGVQIELARAEAGLGEVAIAEERLERLLATYGPAGNPLTIGGLQEAKAEIAALRGDESAFAASVEAVARCFRPTRDPALVARHERLARVASSALAAVAEGATDRRISSRPPRLMTVVHRLRHGGDHTRAGSAEWALKQVAELTRAEEAFLLVPEGGSFTCVAHLGAAKDAVLFTELVQDRLGAHDTVIDVSTCTTDGWRDPSRIDLGNRVYRMTVLRALRDGVDDIVGVFVLPGEENIPFPVLQVIVERLGTSADDSV
jgi:tetratricopeptide (TPR) repeat protein